MSARARSTAVKAHGAETRPFGSVIFDFDYTLADSSPGVIECVNYALQRMELPQAGGEAIRATIGVPLAEMFEQLAGARNGDRFDEFKRLFVERGDEVMLQGIRVFESVKPVVQALLAGGISLGIVSTKFRYRIEQVLQRDGLEHAFAVIVGGEDVAGHKPDPIGLSAAIGSLGRSLAEVLYVGDSVVDAETAGRAGVRFVAVLSGVTPREALAAYLPFAVIDDLTGLPALVLEGRGGEAVPA
jgi:phosphoglycolate phosphatase